VRALKLRRGGLVCAPHVLISATQHWSELEILLPQPFWLESNSAMAPLRVTQCWSVHSALNHWNQFSCWVMLIRTEWLNRTEFYTSITAIIILKIKKKCMNKDWTIAFKDVTWLSPDNIATRPYSNYKTYNHHFICVVLTSTFPNKCWQMPMLDLPSTTLHNSLLPQPPSSMMPTNAPSPCSLMATTTHNDPSCLSHHQRLIHSFHIIAIVLSLSIVNFDMISLQVTSLYG